MKKQSKQQQLRQQHVQQLPQNQQLFMIQGKTAGITQSPKKDTNKKQEKPAQAQPKMNSKQSIAKEQCQIVKDKSGTNTFNKQQQQQQLPLTVVEASLQQEEIKKEEPIQQKISPKEPEKPKEPVKGSVTVKYSHYKDKFDIFDGMLMEASIDEKYCISYVFKGNYQMHLKPEKAIEYVPQGPKCFKNLEDGKTYQLEIEEDANEVEKEQQKAYKFQKQEPQQGSEFANKKRIDNITNELKSMNVEELMEKGDKYKQLIEARDLEDCLYK